MSDYPEHDKLSAISDRSQAIGDFLEWLRSEKGAFLAHEFKWEDDSPTLGEILGIEPENTRDRRVRIKSATMPFSYRVGLLLAEFFEIDQEKIDQEKRAMLEECRAMNKAAP